MGIPRNYPKPHTPNVRARWAVVVLPARACATAPPPLDRGKGAKGRGFRNGTIIYYYILVDRDITGSHLIFLVGRVIYGL